MFFRLFVLFTKQYAPFGKYTGDWAKKPQIKDVTYKQVFLHYGCLFSKHLTSGRLKVFKCGFSRRIGNDKRISSKMISLTSKTMRYWQRTGWKKSYDRRINKPAWALIVPFRSVPFPSVVLRANSFAQDKLLRSEWPWEYRIPVFTRGKYRTRNV